MFRVIRNVSVLLVATVFVLSTFFYGVGRVNAAAAASTVTVNLTVGATISNSCTSPVTMGGITGTGQSALATNTTTCTVITNNSTGYNLVWQASAATMSNGLGDTIAAYTPGSVDTPEVWSVAGADSEWGGHLGSTSTTVNTTTWGVADTYAGGKWVNVKSTGTFQIANRTTDTAAGGDSEVVWFGAEVGASHFQPTGTYTVNVTFTATTNP